MDSPAVFFVVKELKGSKIPVLASFCIGTSPLLNVLLSMRINQESSAIGFGDKRCRFDDSETKFGDRRSGFEDKRALSQKIR
ncbi:hypothetical protein ACFO3D_05110 [Virgibacillus kekensis]|uniref:Uncharacterized protein n=1 Tax=Virgibacillus kekensis TaxID=202261 RepID=A0ABV9DFT6_9BACI